MRVRGLRQRKRAVDNRIELTREEEPCGTQKFALCADVRSEDGEMFGKYHPQVQPDLGTGRGAAGHQTTGAGQRPHALRPCRISDMFENHIDAAPIREAHHFGSYVLLVMMNHLIRS